MPSEYAHIVEDADTEDDLVTNSKDLRMKFMAVAAKDFGGIN
jgi:hypothetical protein